MGYETKDKYGYLLSVTHNYLTLPVGLKSNDKGVPYPSGGRGNEVSMPHCVLGDGI